MIKFLVLILLAFDCSMLWMWLSMGAACCVAAKDRTITSRSGSEVLQRNVRYSPSWSFRWDNRRRVAGEEMSVNSLSDGVNRNDGFDIKSRTTVGSAFVSEEGSPLDSFRSYTWQKSPILERDTGLLCVPPSGTSYCNRKRKKFGILIFCAFRHFHCKWALDPNSRGFT